jgi:hypothetical protein
MYSSPNIIRIMRWARYVACMGRKGIPRRFWGGKARRKETNRKTDIGGSIILKLVLGK